jgi:2-keto-4-pentenoate hydratase/2-oxohepta-3-ene-1,7-dioic acid hydratase in catechol pathway
MKLLRYGVSNQEKPAVLDAEGKIRDLSAHIANIDPDILGQDGLFARLKAIDLATLPIIDDKVRIGSCVHKPGKLICIGFNSKLHTQEMGGKLMPEHEMMVFLKPISAISAAYDPILYTRLMKKLDWEAELAVVIGKKGKYISSQQAHEYIFGYCCMNDLSERYFQLETADTQYTKGKGFDTAASLGPYLVTKDEIIDSKNLNIKLWVNSELRQDFNTSDYISDDISVISYLSQFFTLYPGDIISMGSAPGSAKSWGEDKFLKPNDWVEMTIDGLGCQKQRVIRE